MKTAIKQISIFYIILLTFAIFASAQADGFYIDVGAAVHEYDKRGFQQTEGRKLGSDMGIVEIGYKTGNWTFFRYHESVISQYDAGLDMIGVKYRIIGK